MNVFQQYDAEVFGRYSVTNHLIAVAAEQTGERSPDDVRLRQKEARARAASGEKNRADGKSAYLRPSKNLRRTPARGNAHFLGKARVFSRIGPYSKLLNHHLIVW